MKIRIKRQADAASQPYWEVFDYNEGDRVTVAGLLDYLNHHDDLFDENGRPARRIRWEHSCMQKMCGGCAMVVDHVPVLACSTFIDTKNKEQLTIEPLTKFPVISDLCVDRSCIHDHLKAAALYIGQAAPGNAKEYEYQYTVAKCLKCGLCLEVCPNYKGGDTGFYGAVFANDAYLMHTMTENRGKEIKAAYKKHFQNGCSKSLACRDICPMKLPTLSSIGYMNR